MKKRLLVSLIFSLIVIMAGTIPIHAATSNTITFTGTPAFISISTDPTTWTINGITGSGKMLTNTTYYTNPLGDTTAPSASVVDGECRFTTTNTSNVATDITLNIPNFSGGDASQNSNLGTNDTTKFGAYGYVSGVALAGKVIAKASGSDVLINGLAASTNFKWGVQLTTQSNAWTSATAMSSSATISAVID